MTQASDNSAAYHGDHQQLRHTPPPQNWEKITLFVFGSVFFTVLLAIAWLDRHPSHSSWYIYLWVLAMAAGGVAALLPVRIFVFWGLGGSEPRRRERLLSCNHVPAVGSVLELKWAERTWLRCHGNT